jgi:hypothetical protein
MKEVHLPKLERPGELPGNAPGAESAAVLETVSGLV